MATQPTNIPPIQYQVLITPLLEKGVYGDQVDVTKDINISDFINERGISRITGQIDNGDYDIGLFTFSALTLKAVNSNGRFNPSSDTRSIFPFSRDLAKIDIKFFDGESNIDDCDPHITSDGKNFITSDGKRFCHDGSGIVISFKGLINEDATRQDYFRNEVKFKVLSYDSVFRKTKVPSGLINNGTLFSTAIKSILNLNEIKNILSVDPNNVNVQLDRPIDDGTFFDDQTAKSALDSLLLASNSISFIGDRLEVIVKDRTEFTDKEFLFFGPNDLFGRENIIKITNLNTGIHRLFNSIIVNNRVENDNGSIDTFDLKQKSISLSFVTDNVIEDEIASNILDEFKAPKIEMELTCATKIAKNIGVLDFIRVSLTPRLIPIQSAFLPFWDSGLKWDDGNFWPLEQGDYDVSETLGFKVIGIVEDPKKFSTMLKLRQIGKSISDGTVPVALNTWDSGLLWDSNVLWDN